MFVDDHNKRIIYRIVYAGSDEEGPLVTVANLYEHTRPESRGKLRTLDLGDGYQQNLADLTLRGVKIKGNEVDLFLCTHPIAPLGQRENCRLGDGFVFVAQNDRWKLHKVKDAFAEFTAGLKAAGRDWTTLPLVLQLDGAPDPDALTVSELKDLLGLQDQPIFATHAAEGDEIFKALKQVSKEALRKGDEGAERLPIM